MKTKPWLLQSSISISLNLKKRDESKLPIRNYSVYSTKCFYFIFEIFRLYCLNLYIAFLINVCQFLRGKVRYEKRPNTKHQHCEHNKLLTKSPYCRPLAYTMLECRRNYVHVLRNFLRDTQVFAVTFTLSARHSANWNGKFYWPLIPTPRIYLRTRRNTMIAFTV